MLTFDGTLAVLAILVALAVGVVAWLRPESLRQEYEARIDELEVKIEALQVRYQALSVEYLRIIGENHWLRNQLRAAGIEIAALPDDLKPREDAAGNVSIFIARDSKGGITMTGGKIDIGGDAVAGDERRRGESGKGTS